MDSQPSQEHEPAYLREKPVRGEEQCKGRLVIGSEVFLCELKEGHQDRVTYCWNGVARAFWG